jgi:hypothetical protein
MESLTIHELVVFLLCPVPSVYWLASHLHIRTGLSFLCIIVSVLTYGEWEISKMTFLTISSICSLTSRRNENGIGRLLHDLGNPPCIWNLYSNMLHLPGFVTKCSWYLRISSSNLHFSSYLKFSAIRSRSNDKLVFSFTQLLYVITACNSYIRPSLKRVVPTYSSFLRAKLRASTFRITLASVCTYLPSAIALFIFLYSLGLLSWLYPHYSCLQHSNWTHHKLHYKKSSPWPSSG